MNRHIGETYPFSLAMIDRIVVNAISKLLVISLIFGIYVMQCKTFLFSLYHVIDVVCELSLLVKELIE